MKLAPRNIKVCSICDDLSFTDIPPQLKVKKATNNKNLKVISIYNPKEKQNKSTCFRCRQHINRL